MSGLAAREATREDTDASVQDLSGYVAALKARLAEHYVAPPAPFSVDLLIEGAPIDGVRFVLGSTIETKPFPLEPGDLPAACIGTTRATIELMLADPVGFDPRHPAVMAAGGIRIMGAPRVASYWLQLLKRPSAQGRAALARARDRVALRPVHAVDVIDAGATPGWRRQMWQNLLLGVPTLVRAAIDLPQVGWTLEQWCSNEEALALWTDPATGRQQTLRAFVDTLGRRDGAYTDGCLVPDCWNERFRVPGLPASVPAQLWFGRKAAELVTSLHCDLANSFLMHMHGQKRVQLYAPDQEVCVYPLNAFNTYRPSPVDVARPDLRRFPRFAQAVPLEVALDAGDLLLIPTGWYHCVRAADVTLSISRQVDDEACALFAQQALCEDVSQ